jgi:S1-C subfamily serine protease
VDCRGGDPRRFQTAVLGEAIAINSQIETTGNGGSVGIAFAIPTDTIKRELPKLEDG